MCKTISHKELFEILYTFDSLCSEYSIPYSLHGGTLLGAIREHGFIPWDDDADVTMTRENFKRLEAALRNTRSNYYIRGNIKKQFCILGRNEVWVDIFICDYITENKLLQKLKQHLLTALDIMYRDRESMKLSNLEQYSNAKRLVYKVIFDVGQIFPKKWIATWYCVISEKFLLGNKCMLFRSNDQYKGRTLLFPVEWMASYERVTFRDRQLPVLKNWNDLLCQCYGADYLVPACDDRNAAVHELIRTGNQIIL